MTTLGWMVLALYGGSVIHTWRWFMREELPPMTDEWADVALSIVVGFMCALCFGPIIMGWHTFLYCMRDVDPKKVYRALAGESSEQKSKRLKREARERSEYIASLERELGID
jgi:hypothetical protein